MSTEPVRIASLVQAVIVAVLAVVVSMGVDLSQDQVAAILGATSAVLALIVGVIVRQKVTPV